MPRAALRFSIAACLFAVACETPIVTPVEVRPITPGSGEGVVTDQSILIVDNSGSISRTRQFPHDKALTQSLIAAMPNGNYRAGAIAFGGLDREVQPVAAFDRAALSAWARKQTYLKGSMPLYDVLKGAGLEREEKWPRRYHGRERRLAQRSRHREEPCGVHACGGGPTREGVSGQTLLPHHSGRYLLVRHRVPRKALQGDGLRIASLGELPHDGRSDRGVPARRVSRPRPGGGGPAD